MLAGIAFLGRMKEIGPGIERLAFLLKVIGGANSVKEVSAHAKDACCLKALTHLVVWLSSLERAIFHLSVKYLKAIFYPIVEGEEMAFLNYVYCQRIIGQSKNLISVRWDGSEGICFLFFCLLLGFLRFLRTEGLFCSPYFCHFFIDIGRQAWNFWFQNSVWSIFVDGGTWSFFWMPPQTFMHFYDASCENF